METHFGTLEQAHSLIARQRVIEDLRTLARDSQDLLKATAGDVSEQGKALRARLARALERAAATCSAMQEQAVATTKAAAKQADTVIRDHPYESIGIAFGVGLLIGVLINRKS